MAFPLGLRLYLFATARRARPAPVATDAPPPEMPLRPEGPLIWVHLPEAGALSRPRAELMRRLRATRPGVRLLITAAPGTSLPKDVLSVPPPPETLPDIRAFLAHWRPAMVVLAGASLPPATIHESFRANLPVVLIDAAPPPSGRPARLPGVVSTLLREVSHILASDRAAARALRRLGAPEARIEVCGPLQDQPAVLPHVEAEREALAWLTRARPIWLAAGVPEEEEAAVIAAHSAALRLTHRLLLILVPADPTRGAALAARMGTGQEWTVALRSADQEPEEDVQIYIADTEGEWGGETKTGTGRETGKGAVRRTGCEIAGPAARGTSSEMGLWYRLAPITWLGGSLVATGCTRSPQEPAALGSAILHGPHGGDFADALARLEATGATRPVADAGDLARGLAELLSPDHAATLARNAWETSTAGIEVTDHVVRCLLATLDTATAGTPKDHLPTQRPSQVVASRTGGGAP